VFTPRRSLVATAATIALAGFAALGVAAPASAATVNGTGKVGICKATGSASNPYTFVYAGTEKLIAGSFQADDIVPAFTYTAADGTSTQFLGHNTTESVLTLASCVPTQAVAVYAF
jgi:hypothetical protein